jgi:hypothetical protein
MRQVLTPDDLASVGLAAPGWHPVAIANYEEKGADTDGSTNCIFHFKIIDGPNKGIECRKLLNEKGLKYNKSFMEALGFPKDDNGNYVLTSELFAQTVGHKLQIYIKRGKSNLGNEYNDVADFRAAS